MARYTGTSDDNTAWGLRDRQNLMEGLAGDDLLFGRNRGDWLDGGDGNDTLFGLAGNDRIIGGDGHDHAFGGKGNDTLDGGAGRNLLVGGPGSDTFLLDATLENAFSRIADFDVDRPWHPGAREDAVRVTSADGTTILFKENGAKVDLFVDGAHIATFASAHGRLSADDVRGATTFSGSPASVRTATQNEVVPPAVTAIDAGAVTEDDPPVTIDLLAGAFDPDGGPLSATAVALTDDTGAAVAFVDNLDGTITIDPTLYDDLAEGETRTLTATFIVEDGEGGATLNVATLVVRGRGETVNITNGGDSASDHPAIAADGSAVAFHSHAINLVAGATDANGAIADIFVHEIATGVTVNITDGADGASNDPSISGDGSRVVFWSHASNLVAGEVDLNGNQPDVFLHDRGTGETRNITNGGDGVSYNPAISTDGGTVAFYSHASNLVDGKTDANGNRADVFVHDVATGETVNITDGGDSASYDPAVSADGAWVVYWSHASNLVDGEVDGNGNLPDIFLYDGTTGETINITNGANGPSYNPQISADGSTVVFHSHATNLVDGEVDENGGLADIFRYDVATGQTSSITYGGDRSSYDPAVSGDGSTVVFWSHASNLVASATDANGFSPDIFVHDVASGGTVNVTDGGDAPSYDPVVTSDGTTVAFWSHASNLGDAAAIDGNGNLADVFVYEPF